MNWRFILGLPENPVHARGLLTLMVATFLMWSGFFTIVPLISLHYVDGLQWSAAAVGLALGIRTITQQGLGVFSGAISDKIGARGLILTGLLIRAIGFGSLIFAKDFTGLVISATLSGLGGALFDAPKSAAIAALTDPDSRPKMYAVFGMIGNIGMGLGSLAGAAFLKISFEFAALFSASLYLLTFLGNLRYLPAIQVSSSNEQHTMMSGLAIVIKDKRFVTFTFLLAGMFLMWSQFSLAMTLEGKRLAGTTDAVSWIFLVNTITAVLLQYWLTQTANRYLSPLRTLLLGVLVMAAALYAVAFAPNIIFLLICVAVFSIGSSLASAPQQVIIAELASEQARGAYFGFSALAFAIGGGLGNTLGGALHDLGAKLNWLALPWLLIASSGVITAFGLIWFESKLMPNKTTNP